MPLNDSVALTATSVVHSMPPGDWNVQDRGMSGCGCGALINGSSKSAAVSNWHGPASARRRGVSMRGDVVVTVDVGVGVLVVLVGAACGCVAHEVRATTSPTAPGFSSPGECD
jgi:hypothetical protein